MAGFWLWLSSLVVALFGLVGLVFGVGGLGLFGCSSRWFWFGWFLFGFCWLVGFG